MDINSVYNISNANFTGQDALAALLAKAKQGNQEALTEIYELYFKKLYRFIFFRVGHKQLAEDLAEDVFLRAFTKLSDVSDNASFQGWLYQIARNLVIDHYRQKKQIIDIEELENSLEYESNIIDVLDLQQQQKILLRLMKELGHEQQIVIKLKFLEGLDNAEIAVMLHKSEGAVRVIQHRAITKLQELISAEKPANEI
ncbi:MAG: RNA polymerase sigma factor [Candidatus Doudnabacteria bacterium]|nr:RNA polymerase sigma factor [Candidatus Doudnabacteria bacterium]